MRAYSKVFVFQFLLSVFFTGCASQASPPEQMVMAHAKIEIVAIKKQQWTDELGPEILARGDYLVQVRFLAPERYRNEVTDIPVVKLSDLTIGEVQLQPGDLVEFDTSEKMLTGAAKPYVFTNFKNVKRVGMATTPNNDSR